MKNITCYIIANKYYNKLFSKLIDEISKTEQNLINWKQCWIQRFDLCGFYDSLLDEKLLQEYEYGTIPLLEVFYKADSVLWENIISTKSIRNIEFEKNGQIHFTKNQKNRNQNDYEFLYNILKKGFYLKRCNFGENTELEIDENNICTKIVVNNLKIVYRKESKDKILKYKSPIMDNLSIFLELYVNEQDEIEKCYIDFRTHKCKQKINGIYALRLYRHDCCYSTFKFISRKGIKNDILDDEFSKQAMPIFKTNLNELTFEIVDAIIKKVIPIIIKRTSFKDKLPAEINNNISILDIRALEMETINYVKQIKGEIPLPYLQKNLENFVREYEIKKSYSKKYI